MSRNVRAGGAAIELSVLDRVDKGLKSAAGKMKRFGRGLMGAGAAIAGGMVGLMAMPVKMASDSQETMAKFNTVFGASAANMQQWSNQTAKAMGTSQTEMAGMLASMQDLLVPMGVMPEKATAMNKDFAKLSVDLASFNNVPIAQAFQDITAAVSGSPETMKKYGVVINETLLKQKALELGLTDTIRVLNPAEKAQAAYALMLEGTTAAQGDAIRTQGSFANQTKRLKAAAVDLGTSLGSVLLPPLTNALELFNGAIARVQEWVNANPGLTKAIGMAALAVGAFGGALVAVGATISGLGIVLGGIATAIGFLISPIGIVIGLLVGAGGLAAAWLTMSESGQNAMKAIKDRFGPMVQDVKDSLGTIIHFITKGDWAAAWENAKVMLEVVWLEMTSDIREIWRDLFVSLAEMTADGLNKIGGLMKRFTKALPDLGAPTDFLRGLGVAGSAGLAVGGGAFAESAKKQAEIDRRITEDRIKALRRRIIVTKALVEEEKKLPENQGAGAGGPAAAGASGGLNIFKLAAQGINQLPGIARKLSDAGARMIEENRGEIDTLVSGGPSGSTGTFSAAAAALSGGARSPEFRTMKATETTAQVLQRMEKKEKRATVGP